MGLAVGQAKIMWGEEDPQDIPKIGSLSDFSYEDSLKEDNICQLIFKNSPVVVADRTEVQEGQKIWISWGRGVALIDPILMVLEEPEVDYGTGVSLIMRCHDKGTETKGVTRHRTFPGDWTVDGVAEEIAESWGLESDVEPYAGEFDRVQKRESDWRYLKRLADEIGYRFWIDQDTLHFRPDSQGAPLLMFSYRSGNLMKKFRVRTERQQKKGSQTKTIAQGFDHRSRSVVNGSADATTDPDTQLSAGYVTINAEDGSLIETVGKRIITPRTSQADVDRAAHGIRKSDARGQQVGSFELPGLPWLRAGVFIQIEGVAEIHSGLWRINKSRHTIGGRGYGLQLVLDRETTGSTEGATVPASRRNNQDAANTEDVVIDAETGQIMNL